MRLQFAEIDQSGWAENCAECGELLVWVFHRVHESDEGKRRTAEFRSVCVAECPAYQQTKWTGCGPEYAEVSQTWAPTVTRWW